MKTKVVFVLLVLPLFFLLSSCGCDDLFEKSDACDKTAGIEADNSGGTTNGESSTQRKKVPLPRNPPVPEIRNFQLNDIARTSLDPVTGKPLIFFNPNVVQQAGPVLSDFFLFHEYGHVYLHSGLLASGGFQQDPLSTAWLSHNIEFEADCYATEGLVAVGRSDAVRTAISHFTLVFQAESLTHPSSSARASNIDRCLARRQNGQGLFDFNQVPGELKVKGLLQGEE